MSAISFVKTHPYISAGAVIAVGAGYFLLNSTSISGGGTQTAIDAASIAAGYDFQKFQMGLQAQQAQTQAALDAKRDDNATQVTIANIAAKNNFDVYSLGANLELAKVNASQQTQNLVSTLAADIQGKQINADLDKVKAQYASSDYQTMLLTDVINQQTKAQVSIAQINKPKRGLFSFLFG